MKMILTNDDGIDAPGLDALHGILRTLGTVVVVAPEKPQSWVSHRVTALAPVRVRKVGADRFAVDGTPADCARIALKHIAADAGWVIAGINPGANLGSDVYNSGTVAAAREAAILGCRAMALSQYISRGRSIDWAVTAAHAEPAVRDLMGRPLARGHFWNVNLPHPLCGERCSRRRFCALDTNPHGYRYVSDGELLTYQGVIHERPRDPGKDVAVCFGGEIAVTRLTVDATVYPVAEELAPSPG